MCLCDDYGGGGDLAKVWGKKTSRQQIYDHYGIVSLSLSLPLPSPVLFPCASVFLLTWANIIYFNSINLLAKSNIWDKNKTRQIIILFLRLVDDVSTK